MTNPDRGAGDLAAERGGAAVAPSGRRFAGNAATLAGGELGARVISFAGTLVVANLLGPTAFGAVAVTQSIMLYFAMLSDGGLTLWSQRQLVVHRDRAPRLIADTLATQLLLATVAAGALVIVAFAAPLPHAAATLVLLAIPFMYSQAFSTIYALRGLEHVGVAAVASIVTQVVGSGIAIVLVATTHAPAWAIVSMWIGELVSDVIALTVLLRLVPLGGLGRNTVAAIGPRAWALLRAGSPLLAAAALFQYSTMASSVSLSLVRGAHEVGIYGAAVRPLVLMPMLVAVASYALIPEVVRRLAIGLDAANDFVVQVTALAVRLTLAVAVLAAGLAPTLVRLVYGSAYAPAATVVRIAVAMVPVFAYVGLVSSTISAHGHNRHPMIAQGVSAALATVLLPIGGALAGARGTTVALLVSLVVLAGTLSLVSRPYLGSGIPRGAAVEVCWVLPLLAATVAVQLAGFGVPLTVAAWLLVAAGTELVRGSPTLRAVTGLRE